MAVAPSKSPSSSSGEQRPGAPPPGGLPLRLGRANPTSQSNFMFVHLQSDGAEGSASVGRQERIFVQKRFHQQKKQASIDRLRSRLPTNRVVLRQTMTKGSEEKAQGNDIKKNPTRVQVKTEKVVSLTMTPNQRYGDPFDTFAIPMTGKLWMYLHHYRVRIINCSYPFDASHMQNWWAQKAMTSPAMLQTCAFRAAEDKALVGTIQGISADLIQKSMRDSIYFRMKAIKALNESLQDPAKSATHPTLLLVSALVGNEAIGANFDALLAHKQGLKTLVSIMGGLDDLEHMMLSTVYQGALMLAALQNTEPIFPMLQRFRNGIFHVSNIFEGEELRYDDYMIPTTLLSLGIRFTTSPWHTQIHPTLKSLLEAFRRLIRHFEIGIIFPQVVAPTDNDLFVIIQHELLSTHYSHNHTPGDELESRYQRRHCFNLNEPLRLSLMIYLYTRVSKLQDLPILRYMVETFKQSLEIRLAEISSSSSSSSTLDATAPDLLLWLLFIGGMASQGDSSHAWFVSHLAHVVRSLALEDWATQVRPLLGEFFYTDRPGQMDAEDLWSEVALLTSAYRYIAPKPRLLVIEMD
ncbi:uncharacterized protein N7496_004131 [Penicillium cataractarum]|uniref:Uncharacterized protein n=1 Tax=Penicillium cataractarum TaxID=2100454 RepID=A0A9W9SSL8_9EURO|nr:uncharacterized protein N7496_004131 [Penicillium cataractarum]KAJ5381703.1 hypothetical protein N7496_004131 [Penicillium cataractarum]